MVASFGGGSLGSASGSIEISTDQAKRNIDSLGTAINGFGTNAARSFDSIQTAGFALGGFGAAVLGGFGLAAKAAGDFEFQMSAVQAVSGATGAELDALSDKALQLGADTSFSASESAAAIEELAKAGLGIEEILNGAADGAVALAAAAGISVPEAAVTMSNALNIFSLSGEEATHVADVFAAAANKSAADATDLAAAIGQTGTVAALFGLTLEDTAGALALFADNGLRGSDAGTSLKTALTSMLTPAGEGAKKIEELGLNFRDANGEFIGLAGSADELRAKLSGLSQAERDLALRQIFGQDALRVGAILYKEGGDAVTDYTNAVNDSGAASEAAAARLDNFKGSLEQLRGSVETLSIQIGSFLLPVLREVVDAATRAVNAFIGLPESVQQAAAFIGVAAGGVSALAGGFLLLLPRIYQTVTAFKALGPALSAIGIASGPILLVAAAMAALGVAYKTNLFGFADAVNGVAARVVEGFGQIADVVGGAVAAFRTLGGLKLDAAGLLEGDEAIRRFSKTVTDALGPQAGLAAARGLVAIREPLRNLVVDFQVGRRALRDFFKVITGQSANLGKFRDRLQHLFGDDSGKELFDASRRLRDGIKGFSDALKASTRIDLGTFLSAGGIISGLSRAFVLFSDVLRRDVLPVLGQGLTRAIDGVAGALELLARHMDTISTVVGSVFGAAFDSATSVVSGFANLLRGDVRGAIDEFLDPLRNLANLSIDLANWVLNVGAPQVVLWASDLWTWLRDSALPGFFTLAGDVGEWLLTVAAPTVTGWASDFWTWLRDSGLPGFFTFAGKITTWTLTVAAPTVVGWAGDLWGWIRDTGLSGFFSIAGDVGAWILTVAAPSVLGWAGDLWGWLRETALPGFFNIVGDVAGWTLNILAPGVVPWVADVAAWIQGKLLAIVRGGSGGGPATIDFGGWTLNILEGAAKLAGDIFTWVRNCVTNAWNAVRGQAVSLAGAAISIAQFDCVITAAQVTAAVKTALDAIGRVAVRIGRALVSIDAFDVPNLGGVSRALQAAITALGDFTVSLAKQTFAFGEWVVGVTPDIASAIGTAITAVGDVAASLAKQTFAFGEWAVGAFPDVASAVQTGATELGDFSVALAKQTFQILDGAIDFVWDIAGAVKSKADAIIPDAISLENITFGVLGGGGGGEEGGDPTANASAIATSLSEVAASVEGSRDRIRVALGELALDLSLGGAALDGFAVSYASAGTTIGNAIGAGVALASPTPSVTINTLLTDGGMVFDLWAPLYELKGADLIHGAGRGVVTASEAFSGAVTLVISTGASAATTAAAPFIQVGQTIVGNMIGGVNSASGAFSGSVAGVVSSGIGAANAAASGYVAVGQNIIAGLIAGVNSASGALAGVVASAVSGGIAAANAAADAASPSRKMMKLGGWLMEGLAIGVDRTSPLANRAMSGAVNSMLTTARGLERTVSGPAITAALSASPAMMAGRMAPGAASGGGNLTVQYLFQGDVYGIEAFDDRVAMTAATRLAPAMALATEWQNRANGS